MKTAKHPFFIILKTWFRFHAKFYLESNTNLCLGLMGFNLARKAWPGNRITSVKTEIVIEGYPRSANSFAVQAFLAAQERNDIEIGNHTHSPANILRGVELGKPVLVLIRLPKDAILGSVVYQSVQDGILPDKYWKSLIQLHACRYLKFYKALKGTHDKIVVASFKEVVDDFGAVIVEINQKFGTDFRKFNHTPENVSAIFQNSANHLSPSIERKQLKKKLSPFWDEMKDKQKIRAVENLYTSLINTTKKSSNRQTNPTPH